MKSLETNWIRRKTDKTLPIPEIMEYPLIGSGGGYYSPNLSAEIFTSTGKPISMKYGVIVVGNKYEDDVKMAIIAHEWRHHMQYYAGFKYDEPECNSYEAKGKEYDKVARQYFSSSIAEMDALRFQYKHAGFLGNYEPWMELFYDFVEDLHIKPIISYATYSTTN